MLLGVNPDRVGEALRALVGDRIRLDDDVAIELTRDPAQACGHPPDFDLRLLAGLEAVCRRIELHRNAGWQARVGWRGAGGNARDVERPFADIANDERPLERAFALARQLEQATT